MFKQLETASLYHDEFASSATPPIAGVRNIWIVIAVAAATFWGPPALGSSVPRPPPVWSVPVLVPSLIHSPP